MPGKKKPSRYWVKQEIKWKFESNSTIFSSLNISHFFSLIKLLLIFNNFIYKMYYDHIHISYLFLWVTPIAFSSFSSLLLFLCLLSSFDFVSPTLLCSSPPFLLYLYIFFLFLTFLLYLLLPSYHFLIPVLFCFGFRLVGWLVSFVADDMNSWLQ